MNRKVISAVLIFMMLFSIAAPAFAADFYATVQADSVSGKAGETVTIALNVTENTGFNMLNITVEYDANVLEFVEEITPENGLEVAANKVADGKVNIVFEHEDEYGNYTEKNAKLLDLSFKIKEDCAPGTYDITLKGLGDEPCMDADLEDVLLTLKNGSLVVEGEPTYKATVNGGSGSGEYEAGAVVAIKADVPEGKEFVKWTAEGVTVKDANAASTTFTMPANAVTVTAEFKDIVIVPEKYNVTVTGGTGSGEYEAGAEVAISATVPEGKVFTGWTGDVAFANADAASTTFVMPANNVNVTANFEDKVYAVTVTGGTGSGEYKAGVEVAISATVPEGKVFAGWKAEGVTVKDANAASTTFTMPGNAVTVTATFEDKVVEPEQPVTYKVTVVDGTGSGEYEAGATVAISATVPEGKIFAGWTGDVAFADAKAPSTTFVMPANAVTVTATFEDKVVEPEQPVTYTVVVNDGSGSGEYEEGATVAISATVPEGKEFVNWTGNVNFKEAAATSTTFVMPANNVTVTANLKDKAVKPENGSSVAVEAGSVSGKAGDTVTVGLTVKENSGFNLLTVAVKYDTDVLEFVETVSKVDSLDVDTELKNNAVRLWIEEENEENFVNEHVTVAELTFKIKEDCAVGTYAITLEGWNDQFDADGEDVNVTFTNGIVEVVADDVYVATVNGGIGSGSYKAGAVVAIKATVPEDKKFAGWTGDVEFADTYAAETTFVMPAGDVTITANFKELVVAPEDSSVVVVAGSATGKEGEIVTVSLNVKENTGFNLLTIAAKYDTDALEFVEAVSKVDALDVDTELKSGAVRLWIEEANEENFVNENVTLAELTFKIKEGCAAGTYSITLEGYSDQLDADGENVNVTFENGSVEVVPTFYTVEVVNGKADIAEAKAGDVVTITAFEAAAGYEFTGWTGNVEFKDATAATTTFVMPKGNVTVTANYAELVAYTITVEGGKADAAEAVKGATVTITATVPEGKEFVNWTGEGVIFADANAVATTFTMPANNVAVTANFKDKVTEPEQPATYSVAVSGGSGSGSYAAGTTVAIAAEVPEGKEFVNWTGNVIFADANAAATTFTMPANNVSVTANFKDKVTEPEQPVVTYSVAVSGGSGSGSYAAGTTVAIAAEVPEGKEFVNWTGNVEFANANAAATTFTMPANNVAVTANFRDKVTEPEEPVTYSVAVSGGSGSGSYAAGTTVAISANVPEGKEFVNWTGNVIFADANAAATTFTMPANNVAVTANFRDKVTEPEEPVTYSVAVSGGSGSGNYAAGTTVAISANVPEGKEFVNWTGNVIFADANAAATTFTMPANNVTVTANFKDKVTEPEQPGEPGQTKTYVVNVIYGEGDGSYEAGKLVTIKADPAPAGKTFDKWLIFKGDMKLANENAAETTFVMPDMDVEVQAQYKTKSSGGSGGGGIGGGGAINGGSDTPSDKEDVVQDKTETVPKVIILTIGKLVAKVDGKDVLCDVAPLIKDGRTYTPARFIAELLGAKVSWNGAKQLVTVTKDDTVIEMKIGSSVAKVNGKAVEMGAAAFIKDGRTYTPARFVAKQLGASVDWNKTTRQVIITTAASEK